MLDNYFDYKKHKQILKKTEEHNKVICIPNYNYI